MSNGSPFPYSCSPSSDGVPDAPVSALPAALTSLVGREEEIEGLRALLGNGGPRLVTVMGPGGVGKTRLAMEIARRAEHEFAGGVVVMELASIAHPEHILPGIASALGLRQREQTPLLDQVIRELATRHTMLLLDNFEHLLGEPPTWLTTLLAACPQVTAFVTSRVALHLDGEHRFPVAPLSLPDASTRSTMPGTASVSLFTQRARAVRPDFDVGEHSLRTIGEICRRLDGLPLAIELAAARMNVFSPDELLARLATTPNLLNSGPRDATHRQQSLRDAIAWSYELLTPAEQQLFRRLSVFIGGFTLTAAEMVGDDTQLDPITGVASLVDKSLLHIQPAPRGGATRYLMLETIREFSLEHLASGDVEEGEARKRHASWCLNLVRPANPIDPSHQELWLIGLDVEHGNLVSAMQWLECSGRITALAELVTQLRWFWHLNGRNAEGMQWYEFVLARYPDRSHHIHIDTLRWAGHMAQILGRPEASTYLQTALSAAHASGDTQREAAVTELLAIMAKDQGEYDLAETRFHRAMSLYDQTSYPWKRRTTDYHLGVVAYGQGDIASATSRLELARTAALEVDDKIVPVGCSAFLALIACEQGEMNAAASHIRQMAECARGVYPLTDPVLLRTLGAFASASQMDTTAARLLGASSSHGDAVILPERSMFERAEAASRHRMGDAAFDHAWQEIRNLSPKHVLDEAERVLQQASGDGSPEQEPTTSDYGLTPRELEVLRLLAEGLSNQQIADRIFTSRKTVANQVASILGKLAVDSRTAAAIFAIRNRLI